MTNKRIEIDITETTKEAIEAVCVVGAMVVFMGFLYKLATPFDKGV